MDLYLDCVYGDDSCAWRINLISVYQPFLMRTKYKFWHLCIFKQQVLILTVWALQLHFILSC